MEGVQHVVQVVFLEETNKQGKETREFYSLDLLMSQVTCQSQTRRCCRPQGRRAPQHPTDICLTRNGEVKRRAADAYYPSALIYSPRAGCQ